MENFIYRAITIIALVFALFLILGIGALAIYCLIEYTIPTLVILLILLARVEYRYMKKVKQYIKAIKFKK